MDKAEHALRLKAAMAEKGLRREQIADVAGVNVRTVTNWTTGKTSTPEHDRVKLRRLLGDYDTIGDPVEVALAKSELADWRQDAVRSVYRKHLHEQRSEAV